MKCPNDGIDWLIGGMCRRLARQIGIDATVGWVKPAALACSNLTASDVEIVLASGPPFSAFPLAQRLAQRLKRPFVLDYRDLWSRNLHGPVPNAARQEASILADSAAVTVVSPSWASLLDQQFAVGSKLHVVSNGYDSEDLGNVLAHEFGHFAIVYAGGFYPPKRVISPMMAALRLLEKVRADERWMFHYYGKHERHVLEQAERFGVTRRVVLHGHVARQRALEAIKGAGVAVVITSVSDTGTPEENGMVTGKIFEAVGLGTPTLLVAPHGSDASGVAEATGMVRSFTASDLDGMVGFLSGLLDGNSLVAKECAEYAWERLARSFHSVLSETIQR